MASSIPDLLAETAGRYADQPAVVDGDTMLSYGELQSAAEEFAAALVASGVEPGHRVALWAPNSNRWIVAALGILCAGATLVPINTRFKGAEARVVLERSGAKLVVTVTDFLGADYVSMLREGATGPLPEIVIAAGPPRPGTVDWSDLLGRASGTARSEVASRSAAVGPEDPSDILFTSGTTGVPKGVVQTHSRTLCVATDWVEMAGLQAGDRYLMINPYFHMFGLKAGILACVAAGAVMYPVATFDLDDVMRRIATDRITVFPGAPTIYQSVLAHPGFKDADLSSLRVAVTGAADIPVELIRKIDAELPFKVLVSGYGLTEAGTATGTRPGDSVETIATTVGRARPSFQLRIVDSAGAEVGAGETGEILLKGPSVMSHYLDDPSATAEALSPDGWLSTGDLGTLDDDGNLKIVGRSKDMFIVGGFNAYPAEIENALLRHPAVGAVAVIGIPDERMGEVGMAFVVPAPGASATAEEIIAWSRKEMANYKVPRAVRFVDALPVNATGKVVKDELRALV